MCPREFGRPSTFLRAAPFRKARVVGPACIRRCPRFFTSFRGESEKRSKFNSDSQAGLVAWASQMRATNRIADDWPDGREACVGAQVFPTRSRGCKLRGGPKISRKMIASRKPDFDASKVAMSVLKSAPLATGRVAAA